MNRAGHNTAGISRGRLPWGGFEKTSLCASICGAVLGVAMAVSLCACKREPPPKLSSQDETLVLDQKWEQAIPLLKKHLLASPEDAAAHYYLGACYLNLSDPVLAAAEGEFEVALTLFRRNGMESRIERVTPKDFELRCYLGLANVYIRSLGVAMGLNANMSIVNQMVRNLGAAVSNAESIAPDDPRVKRLQVLLDNLIHRPGLPPPPEGPQSRVSA